MTEQLVYVYHWGGEPCSGTNFIPFEYEGTDKMSAKEKFCYDALEKFKGHQWEYYQPYGSKGKPSDYDTDKVEIFDDVYLTKGDLNQIEHSVMTLEQWFESRKDKPKTI
jgi:hypothetical protein